MNVVGIDIGGANLKFADLNQRACTQSFPLWKTPERLAQELTRGLKHFAPVDFVAVTMTGELADCFPNRSTGVQHIVAAMLQAVAGMPVFFWQTAGEFVEPEIATEFPMLTASANWHALATWAARITPVDQTGLLIDIGSTTVDIIPLAAGMPCPQGLTDLQRLASRELLYTGGKRTPLMAVCQEVQWDDQTLPVAAELFATMQDIYLLTGDLPEVPEDTDTADGRPADQAHAAQRLARMLCTDAEELTPDEQRSLVSQFEQAQQTQIRTAIRQVITSLEKPPQQIILSGSCSFIFEKLLPDLPELQAAGLTRLEQQLGPEISSAACAFAVAQLAVERLI